jgi:hypothetical protein
MPNPQPCVSDGAFSRWNATTKEKFDEQSQMEADEACGKGVARVRILLKF